MQGTTPLDRSIRGRMDPSRVFSHPAAAPLLIGIFLLLSVGADLAWPSRKSYFATYTYTFKNFTVLHPVPTGSYFTPGGGGQELYSPLYMGLLRACYRLVPHRLAAMRTLSIVCAVICLYLLFLTVRRLFSSPEAGLLLFLLATSPIYLESMRAFGYQSLSHLAVILTVYFTVSSREKSGWAAAAAVAAFSTLALYVTARPAAAFPVLFYLLEPKKSWKRLLLYLAVFAALLTAAGLAERRPLTYPWRYFTSPEEQAGLWPVEEGRVNWDGLSRHLARNSRLAAGYLLSTGRRPFADRESSSRLFNPVYTPFLLLGLAGVWFRKRDGRNAILIMLFLFFLLPLASREIQPRRILVSIYPLYLLIVLGLSLTFRFVLRRRELFGWLAIPALLAVGAWDLHEFVFRVSRPRLNYPRSELKAVARFVEENWREVSHIRYYKEIDELIMGNPYFVPQPEKIAGVANVFAEERRDPRRTLEIFSSRVGEDLIYLYTDPPLRIDRESPAWAIRLFGNLIRQGKVPGTASLFYLRADLSGISPNLIFQGDEYMRFRIRGRLPQERLADKEGRWLYQWSIPELFDGNPAAFVLIEPPQEGGPIAIDFQLGEAVDVPVRSISFRVPSRRGDHFFRRAELLAGSYGGDWERLARFEVSRRPAGGEWLNFEFESPLIYPLYRLEFPEVGWEPGTGRLALAGIWMFDRVERELKIEELLRGTD